jgi:hypothetical protein
MKIMHSLGPPRAFFKEQAFVMKMDCPVGIFTGKN